MKKQQYCNDDQSKLPIDLAFEIVSSLEAVDVCSLGSCSKFWNQICVSDCLWESLCKQRWPALATFNQDSDPQQDCKKLKNNKGWKDIYSEKHAKMAEKTKSYRKCLAGGCVDIDDYLKVIEDMKNTRFGFNDIIIFFFKPNKENNVLLNLAGLHYFIKHVNLQVEDVLEAITRSNIQENKVCIQWRRKGGWTHRFPLPDQLHRRCLSLKDLIAIKGNEEALNVIDRGLNEVVVQVQITSSVPPECSGGCEFTYVLPYWESTPKIQSMVSIKEAA